jgi:hypothetical protein
VSKILYRIDYRYTNEWKVEMGDTEISASDWARGILLSILASVIGGISKLSIRNLWLLVGVRCRQHLSVDLAPFRDRHPFGYYKSRKDLLDSLLPEELKN